MDSEYLDDDPETVVHKEMNRLRGRLCGLIESWGLGDRRERGAIATLKTLTYDSEKLFVDMLNEPMDAQICTCDHSCGSSGETCNGYPRYLIGG
jgi:hypothetical protein